MTVIRPNSISGITSITAQGDTISLFRSDGTTVGALNLNVNASSGVSTFANLVATGNVSIAGTLTYEDVTNVDSIGIVTARTGVRIDAGGIVVVGVTTVAAGTTSAPSISPTGDSNTGIFFPSADTIAFAEGGAEVARFDSSGRFGIGTASPSARLDVNAGTDNTVAAFTSTDAGAYASFNDPTGQGIVGQEGANLILSCDPGASVGSSAIVFQVDANAERARIDSSGRLLVGTASAFRSDSFIQIKGGNSTSVASLALGSTTNNPTSGTDLGAIVISDTGGNRGASIIATADGNWTSGTSNPTYLSFQTTASGASSPTERMRINKNGYVQIGTSQATYPNPGIGLYPFGYAEIGKNASISGDGFLAFSRNNVLIGSITQSGTTGVAYNTSSDYRLKENVEPINGAVERLLQLKPSRFNFISDPDTTVDGFIAHEAQAVVPESVHGTKDEVDEDGKPVHQGIDQSKLVPLLTAALQEAVAEIKALKDRVTALESE
jgi:hypothetical protein